MLLGRTLHGVVAESGLRPSPGSTRDASSQRAIENAPLGVVPRAQQRDRATLPTHTSGATDAMRHELGRFRQFEVDHLIDGGDVESARRDVGRDENLHFTIAKLLHHPVARVLGEVALQRADGIAVPLEPMGELLDAVLRPSKDDDRAVPAQIEQIPQGFELVVVGKVVGHVLDVWSVLWPLVDGDESRVVEVLAGGVVDPLRHRSREEGGLPRSWRIAEDALHVGRESTIEHLVRLVENQEANVVQFEIATVDQVEHTTRRADHDLRAAAQTCDLRTGGATTENQRRANGPIGRHVSEDLVDLNRELASWSQNQHLNLASRGVNQFDGGDQEGERFAGAGARLTDDILAV